MTFFSLRQLRQRSILTRNSLGFGVFILSACGCLSVHGAPPRVVVETDRHLASLSETESLIGLDFEAEYELKFYQVIPDPFPITAAGQDPIQAPWEPRPENLELAQYQNIHYWQHDSKVAWERTYGYMYLPEELLAKDPEGWERVVYDGSQYIKWRRDLPGDEVARRKTGMRLPNVFITRHASYPCKIITPLNVFSFGTNLPVAQAIDKFASDVTLMHGNQDEIIYAVTMKSNEDAKRPGFLIYLDTSRGYLPSRAYQLGDEVYVAMFARKWVDVRSPRFPGGKCQLPSQVWWQLIGLDKKSNTMCVVSHMAMEVSRFSMAPVDQAIFHIDTYLHPDDVATYVKR